MRAVGLMTVLILLAIVVSFLAGLVLILRSIRNRSRADEGVVCPRCRTANAECAKFCSQCGASLQ